VRQNLNDEGILRPCPHRSLRFCPGSQARSWGAPIASVDWRNKAVALPRNCLDKSWIFCRIPQSFSHSIDRGIQTTIEVYKGVGRPQSSLQPLAGDQLARMLDYDTENLERLASELDS